MQVIVAILGAIAGTANLVILVLINSGEMKWDFASACSLAYAFFGYTAAASICIYLRKARRKAA